eukprot:TRINITY_DN1320_c0_g1_i2.p2 TRINITY_DN1320_c0_g1~~TRINITY_DN1320_c0_g1_i2.p2  ORF type:complete len:129 (+),score=29.96 TRINITY_DN1320_c0_g1_i2:738-1124(+)
MKASPPFPTCPKCHGTLRPNIYLFGDGNRFLDAGTAKDNAAYNAWVEYVLSQLSVGKKLVLLEVGCGLRVPNIRRRLEELHSKCPPGTSTFIRINPDYPDNPLLCNPTIAIRDHGLAALRSINDKCSF